MKTWIIAIIIVLYAGFNVGSMFGEELKDIQTLSI